ncbi:MAG TPA: PilZ domain-containing protein [Allosphingosinicella sp.]|nr:PilZ domain-containing protein [Allosphingosinicella sp.]
MLTRLTSRVLDLPARLPGDLERRRGRRIHTVLRVAKVRRAHDAGLWRVCNMSDGGMMMATSVPVAAGERLAIALSDRVTLAATLRWWDGAHCGVAFDRPVDCAALLHALVAEQRAPFYRPPRLPVSSRAIVYCDKGLYSVRLLNLSQHGAGFAHAGRLLPGMAAKLLFEDGDEHRGVVRWSRDGRAGMYLVEPFPCARLESACRL